MFITNNYASLHLWRAENLLKPPNISKYYDEVVGHFHDELFLKNTEIP